MKGSMMNKDDFVETPEFHKCYDVNLSSWVFPGHNSEVTVYFSEKKQRYFQVHHSAEMYRFTDVRAQDQLSALPFGEWVRFS